jgi:hypothetical protein
MPLIADDLKDLKEYKLKCDQSGITPKATVRKLVIRLANTLGNPGPGVGQIEKFLKENDLWEDYLGDGNMDPD